MKNKFLIYSIVLLVSCFFIFLPFVGVDFSHAQTLAQKLSGRILLQVEKNGEAWYVYPNTLERFYMGRPADAFSIMKELSLGISESNYYKFNGYAPANLSGKILLRPEANGEAYYVYPEDLKMYFLDRPKDAFDIMRNLGLGITNANLDQIPISENSLTPYTAPKVFTHYENCYNDTCENEDFNYLIVTRPLFEATLEDFISWKKGQGFKVGLVTADWISGSYSGIHFADKIKKFIKTVHDANGLKYVLLVGDSDYSGEWTYDSLNAVGTSFDNYYSQSFASDWDIPSGYFSNEQWARDPETHQKTHIEFYSLNMTDLFYVSLKNWDANGNGVYEEAKDLLFNYENWDFDKSWLGDIYLGRWPVRTNSELQNIIDKTKINPKISSFTSIAGTTDNENIIENFKMYSPLYSPYKYVLDNQYNGLPVKFVNNVDDLSASKIQERVDAFSSLSNINYIQYKSIDHEVIDSYFYNNTGYLLESAHGSHRCIAPYGSEGRVCTYNLTFKNVFPVFDLSSCEVQGYFVGAEDVFSEHFLKQEKGPAIVIGTLGRTDSTYYQNLMAGKSIGESFFSSLKNSQNTGISWANMILGDPSLILVE